MIYGLPTTTVRGFNGAKCHACALDEGQEKLTKVTLITEPELLSVLKSCTDSASGSDGIPYSVYKKLWGIVGP